MNEEKLKEITEQPSFKMLQNILDKYIVRTEHKEATTDLLNFAGEYARETFNSSLQKND